MKISHQWNISDFVPHEKPVNAGLRISQLIPSHFLRIWWHQYPAVSGQVESSLSGDESCSDKSQVCCSERLTQSVINIFAKFLWSLEYLQCWIKFVGEYQNIIHGIPTIATWYPNYCSIKLSITKSQANFSHWLLVPGGPLCRKCLAFVWRDSQMLRWGPPAVTCLRDQSDHYCFFKIRLSTIDLTIIMLTYPCIVRVYGGKCFHIVVFHPLKCYLAAYRLWIAWIARLNEWVWSWTEWFWLNRRICSLTSVSQTVCPVWYHCPWSGSPGWRM